MESTGQQTPKRQWLGKKPLFIIGGVLLLLAVSSGIWLLVKNDTPTINADLSKSLDEAAAKQSIGDYQAVIDGLTAAEGQAATKEEKVRLYGEIAAAASSAGNLDKALEYYAKKHQLDPGSKNEDGYVIGVIYERKDDPQKALEYYRLYAEYLKTTPDNEMQGALQASLDETIQRLEEQTQ